MGGRGWVNKKCGSELGEWRKGRREGWWVGERRWQWCSKGDQSNRQVVGNNVPSKAVDSFHTLHTIFFMMEH